MDVIEFKPGSVIAVLKVTASSSNENLMKSALENEMKDGNLGGFSVDPTLYSGAVFDVVLKVKFVCNDSAVDKGFDRKGDLENAINTVMSTHPKFVAANIQNIACLEKDNITMVTARVQISDPSVANPNKELSGLKIAVNAGQVGNFLVVSEWASYIPGEKLFYVRASLQSESSNTAQTQKDLETFIADVFKGEANFRYANVDVPDNKTVVIEIGMSSSASELPLLALSSLDSSLRTATLGSLNVVKNTIRVTIDPKFLTRKVFQATFQQNVSNCKAADIADINSLHYKNLSMGIWEFIDSNIKANKDLNKLYLETKVTNLNCHNKTTVRGVSDFYVKSNTEDRIVQFLWPLYKCKKPGIYDWGIKILLRTPTLPDTKGTWLQLLGVYTHFVCPRRKPPTPSPTSVSPSTGSPTTTRIPTNATEPPSQNTTEPTATSETSKAPTTKATLPTTSSTKPELYIKLKLGMTWGEFCSKRETLTERIARNLHDKSGTKLSPDRIIYVNAQRNCADPSKKNELAKVWFYVSKSGSKEVHKCLTLKAYKMFKMFFENGNTKQLGPEFQEKVFDVFFFHYSLHCTSVKFQKRTRKTLGERDW